jgi:cytoskeletal protein CcmA (bactofilin family)
VDCLDGSNGFGTNVFYRPKEKLIVYERIGFDKFTKAFLTSVLKGDFPVFDKIMRKTEPAASTVAITSDPTSESKSMSDIKKNILPTDAYRSTNGPRSTSGQTTVLTPDAEFKGSLAFSGELQLNGRLEGSIESDGGSLIIGEEAIIKADIKVNEVVVYGKVQGNITAQGRIELRGKAHVYGDIRSNRIMIEDGVVFVGRSETLSGKSEVKEDFSQIFNRLNKSGKPTNGSSSSVSSTEAPIKV